LALQAGEIQILTWDYDPSRSQSAKRAPGAGSALPSLPLASPFTECGGVRAEAELLDAGVSPAPADALRLANRERYILPFCDGSGTLTHTVVRYDALPGTVLEVDAEMGEASDPLQAESVALSPLACDGDLDAITWRTFGGRTRTRLARRNQETWNGQSADGWAAFRCAGGRVIQVAHRVSERTSLAFAPLRNDQGHAVVAPLGTLWGDSPWHDSRRIGGIGLGDLATGLVGSQFRPAAPDWSGQSVRYRLLIGEDIDEGTLDLFAHPPLARAGALPESESPFFSDRVLNIAHRGGNLLAPEETVEAFHSALKVGADVLEMDISATSDGVIVLMHDATVDRTTNGTGMVKEMTFAEIRALDAGFRHTSDGGQTFPFRGQGVVVPSLEEVLTIFADRYMVIEIKQSEPSIVDALDELLTRSGMRDRIIIASFDDAVIQEFRAAAPDVLTSFALGEAVDFYLLAPEAEKSYVPPAEFLQVPPTFDGIEVLTPEFIARARRFGLRIHVWDVFTAAMMEELIDLGMDGLIIDDPETMEEILRRRAGLAQQGAAEDGLQPPIHIEQRNHENTKDKE
jgi:glycerophosphoryl diester phosphodiesterase